MCAKKGVKLFFYVTLSKINQILMLFSLLDLKMNDTRNTDLT